MGTTHNIKFTCQVPPSVNESYWLKTTYIKGKYIPTKVLTTQARKFKEQTSKIIQREMLKQNIKYLCNDKTKYVELNVDMFLQRKRKDADNQFKLLQDAIVQSGLILDDDIIMPKVNNIIIDKFNPRLEVNIYISEKIGIFKDVKELKNFKANNCDKCKRFQKNCSLLQKMLDNRIIEEVEFPLKQNSKCNKKNPII